MKSLLIENKELMKDFDYNKNQSLILKIFVLVLIKEFGGNVINVVMNGRQRL